MRFKYILFFILFISACVNKTATVKAPSNGQNNAANTAPANANGASNLPTGVATILPAKQTHADALLAFIESYSNLTPEAQRKAFASTNQTLAENKNNLNARSDLAVIYALPTSRLRDPAKAQVLLQELLREDSLEPSESALLGLLYEYSLEPIKPPQKNRDEVKKLELTQQKYDALLQKNEALLQKNEALEKKLNELKNIEKTMSERAIKSDNKADAKP